MVHWDGVLVIFALHFSRPGYATLPSILFCFCLLFRRLCWFDILLLNLFCSCFGLLLLYKSPCFYVFAGLARRIPCTLAVYYTRLVASP